MELRSKGAFVVENSREVVGYTDITFWSDKCGEVSKGANKFLRKLLEKDRGGGDSWELEDLGGGGGRYT